ncbi:MAG: glycosyltransferase family 4 protein [Planctomycetota bacterium]|jgi:glycosyltransferase involved in cell wall biosynthesis
MRFALYHGYALTGSGSNEYTRYLSRALAAEGHDVQVLCRESEPEVVPHVARGWSWSAEGEPTLLFDRPIDLSGSVTVHRLPHAGVRPVYLADKQRPGKVKPFPALSDEELLAYHELNVRLVTRVLKRHPVDVLHANHLVYQPVVAAEACAAARTPFIIFPHGSSIEYTVREDARYLDRARDALHACDGLVTGSAEMRDRILGIYPELEGELLPKTEIVGVGVDTDLFRPIGSSERAAAIERLLDESGATGKDPALSVELRARLDRGEIEAVKDYRRAYDHRRPDRDLASKLRSIDWEAPVLLFVGALTAGKGVQSLIAAMPAILRDHPGAQLLVVGSGSYRETLEAFVHAVATGQSSAVEELVEKGWGLENGKRKGAWEDVRSHLAQDPHALDRCPSLAGRVTFLGRLDHALLHELFPCADLAVFPSLVPEAYPLVLMESLANGVLPLVTDFSGFAEGLTLLEPHLGRNLVDRLRLPREPDGRISAIAGRIGSLLGEEASEQTRSRLRAIAVNHFDWQIRAEEYVNVIGRLLRK